MKIGETYTIAGVYKKNPEYRWWTFWKPKTLNELQVFVVEGVVTSGSTAAKI